MEHLQQLTDNELVYYFQKGQNHAFDILVTRYKDNLYSYVRHMVRKREDVDDLFQNILIKAMLRIRNGKYMETGKFPNFLSRVAHNCIIDYYRFAKENPHLLKEGLEFDLFNSRRYSEETTEDKMVRRQIYKNVRKMILCLPENQQQIIIMKYYKELTFKQISAVEGVGINTALGRMRYAVLNLRKMLDDSPGFLTS